VAQVTGIVRVKINGTLHRTKTGEVLNFGGRTRTAQMGHSLYGFSEEFTPSVITVTIAHTADLDVSELRDLVDGVVQYETDTGITFQVDGAFTSTPPELTGGEGDLTVEITGNPAVEV
jgi:hypothetical protein